MIFATPASGAGSTEWQAVLEIDRVDEMAPEKVCPADALRQLVIPDQHIVEQDIVDTKVTCDSLFDEVGTNAPAAKPITPPSAQFAADRNECLSGHYGDEFSWIVVEAEPDGFVTGNCQEEYINQVNKYSPSGLWFGGYITSPGFGGCGWIIWDQMEPQGQLQSGACSNPSRAHADYMREVNGTQYSRDGQKHLTDGTLVNNPGICTMYANVRPWANPVTPRDQLRTIGANSKWPTGSNDHRIKWRYVTRNADASGFYWVMIRDRGTPSGAGNWGFVRRDCLAPTLPAQPGYDKWYP